jgi:hypothetical protein
MTPRKLPEHERPSGNSLQHTACIATKVPHNPTLERRRGAEGVDSPGKTSIQ